MDLFEEFVYGHLSTAGRVWTAVGPAIVFAAYFVVGMVVYLARYARLGPYHDAEVEKRGSSVLAGMFLRQYFAWMMQPLWGLVLYSGVPATAITTLSVLLSLGSGVSAASGRFALAGWLFLFSGMCDFFDGRLARARGQTSKAGAVLDSALDRYSDSAVMVGLAWYYRDSWVLLAVLFALVGSWLVPYIRARGEAAGVAMTIGIMQRAERILYLGVAVAISPAIEAILDPGETHPVHRVAIVALIMLAVSTQMTAIQRLLHLLMALDDLSENRFKFNHSGFARAIFASAVATAADFLTMVMLVSQEKLRPALATMVGCVVGAGINFVLRRALAVGSRPSATSQFCRYAFVALTSALLNSGGVAIMMLIPSIVYWLGWPFVRIAVFLTWNFPLHRDYVFVAATGARTGTAQPKT